jgi:hypothetical protein
LALAGQVFQDERQLNAMEIEIDEEGQRMASAWASNLVAGITATRH